jgi:hypothetical protein
MPWTIIGLVVIWILFDVITFLVPRPGNLSGVAFGVARLFQLISPLLITALIVHGLLHRFRFVWAIAIALQLIKAGYGVINLVINDYPFRWILEVRQIPFYGGALPIAVGIVSLILLLLPTTQRWIGTD